MSTCSKTTMLYYTRTVVTKARPRGKMWEIIDNISKTKRCRKKVNNKTVDLP